ncbi:MAG: YcgN family cysteine cluster protein [Rhodospirillales bacterium]|jgi:uncharacterized cysteine cluster protein YcgN (CxxCxxCC family)|nr:YcgN family cysteine cluster protein [Rhodospirillales bacterium]
MPEFWETKTLEAMTPREWESLCDGCGRCCLHKLRDEDTNELSFTNVACRLLDTGTARCRDYANRKRHVPDCIRLTPARVRQSDWLPPSCAYRLIAEGKPLPPWHPLRSRRAETVVEAGASVIGRVISEREAGPLEHHVTEWPGRRPRRRTPEFA